MAKSLEISTKRLAISKTNAQMVAVVAAAAFITVFCLVASKAVLSQNQYQSRVTAAKTKAHVQLQNNIDTFGSLVTAYDKFNGASTNIIGGNSAGSGDNDGDNAKIILDSLPGVYDFPALTSSLEKVLADRGFSVSSITGTDDQLNQQTATRVILVACSVDSDCGGGTNTSSPAPQAVSMPFSFNVDNANYASVGQLITALQQSIRPIQIDSINLSGGASNMTLTVNAHTYYQPAKAVSITKQVIK